MHNSQVVASTNHGETSFHELEEQQPDKCRVCTISSDCFSYMNIFEKIIFKNVLVLDALVLITSLQVILLKYKEFNVDTKELNYLNIFSDQTRRWITKNNLLSL